MIILLYDVVFGHGSFIFCIQEWSRAQKNRLRQVLRGKLKVFFYRRCKVDWIMDFSRISGLFAELMFSQHMSHWREGWRVPNNLFCSHIGIRQRKTSYFCQINAKTLRSYWQTMNYDWVPTFPTLFTCSRPVAQIKHVFACQQNQIAEKW